MALIPIRTLSGLAAWLLAGLIVAEAVARHIGKDAVPLALPDLWMAFLALGVLAGLARREWHLLAPMGIVALAVFAAFPRLPEIGLSPALVDGFTFCIAAMAGVHAGRATALLLDRRHRTSSPLPLGTTSPSPHGDSPPRTSFR